MVVPAEGGEVPILTRRDRRARGPLALRLHALGDEPNPVRRIVALVGGDPSSVGWLPGVGDLDVVAGLPPDHGAEGHDARVGARRREAAGDEALPAEAGVRAAREAVERECGVGLAREVEGVGRLALHAERGLEGADARVERFVYTGTVGVLGPTRMRYSKAITAVDVAAIAVARVLRDVN